MNIKRLLTLASLLLIALPAFTVGHAQTFGPPDPLTFPITADLLVSGPGDWSSQGEGWYHIPPSWAISIEGWADEVYQVDDTCNFVQVLVAKSGINYRTVFWKTDGMTPEEIAFWQSEGWYLEDGTAWNLCAGKTYLAWTNIEAWIVSEVGGGVFEDLDADGLWEQGESGISDVSVSLTDCEQAVYQTVVTSIWNYRFYNVSPGSYCVLVDESTLPPGVWELTTSANPLTITVRGSEVIDWLHFGYHEAPPTPSPTSTATATRTPTPTATSTTPPTPTITPEPPVVYNSHLPLAMKNFQGEERTKPEIHHRSGDRPIDGGVSPGTGPENALRFWMQNTQGWQFVTWKVVESVNSETRTILWENVNCTALECSSSLIVGSADNPTPKPGSQLTVTAQGYPDRGASNCNKTIYVDP